MFIDNVPVDREHQRVLLTKKYARDLKITKCEVGSENEANILGRCKWKSYMSATVHDINKDDLNGRKQSCEWYFEKSEQGA